MESALSDFASELESGQKLCIMPVPRLCLHAPSKRISDCNLYPAGMLDLDELRIVSYPAYEFAEAKRKGYGDLAWIQSGATQIVPNDFRDCALVAFTALIDFPALFSGTHAYHKDVLREMSEYAERAMDLVRFNYCRLDLPDTLPGRVGTFGSDSPFSGALFYTMQDHEGYILGAELVTHRVSGGLGLELDRDAGPISIGRGEVGNIARRGLSLLSTAMEANSLTAKFTQCFFTLEFLAFPYDVKKMEVVKGQIATHLARDKAHYHAICEQLRSWTHCLDADERQIGLRTNMVHLGERFESLVPNHIDQTRIFQKLQQYIGKTIHDLIGMSDQDWRAVRVFRETRRQALNLT
jgi:hypothetical protein